MIAINYKLGILLWYIESGYSSVVEHNLAKVVVEGSTPFARSKLWGHSSVGRASALQAEGHRFESVCLHHKFSHSLQNILILKIKALLSQNKFEWK